MHNLGDYFKNIELELPGPKQETYEDIETEFGSLIAHLKGLGFTDIRISLKQLQVNQIPEQFRNSFSFFKSLSGASRNFLIDVATGNKKNKTHAKEPKKKEKLKPYNSLSYSGE